MRTLLPLVMETVLASVKRTGKVLVLHEAPLFAGLGGEIASRIADEAFEYLDAPVKRIGALDSFVPFAPSLEAAVLPSAEQVAQTLLDLLRYTLWGATLLLLVRPAPSTQPRGLFRVLAGVEVVLMGWGLAVVARGFGAGRVDPGALAASSLAWAVFALVLRPNRCR